MLHAWGMTCKLPRCGLCRSELPNRNHGAGLINEPHRPFLREDENIGEQQVNARHRRHFRPVLRQRGIGAKPDIEGEINERVGEQDHQTERPVRHENPQRPVGVEQRSAVGGAGVIFLRQDKRDQKARNHEKALHGHPAVHDVVAPHGAEMPQRDRHRQQEAKGPHLPPSDGNPILPSLPRIPPMWTRVASKI